MTKKSPVVLITGASGFLGKQLLKKLKNKNKSLYPTAFHENIKLGIKQLDLIDFKKVKEVINKIQPAIIYHLGARVDLSRDFQTTKNCLQVNLIGTLNLLEVLRDHPPKKFIFTSTEEVYGDNPLPFKETQLPRPPSGYSISKIAAENFCQLYSQETGFPLVILRIGTIYGPGQPKERFISQLIIKAIKNQPLLLNSGIKKRDYIYIDDVLNALISAGEKNLKNQTEIINIGGGVSYELKQVAALIVNLSKSKSTILANVIPDRIGETNEWLMGNSKAQKLLGWRPKTSLEKGLKLEINSFKKLN